MAKGPPELIARLTSGAENAPDASALITGGETLGRAALLGRIQGGVQQGAHSETRSVAPGDPGTWVPWLAASALSGNRFVFDDGGIGTPPPIGAQRSAAVSPETPFLVVTTSGSTGPPRYLLRDSAAWLRCFLAEEAFLGLRPEDRILALGAPSFSLTPYVALRAVHLGACLGVLETVRPQAARSLSRQLDPTVIYGVPPLVALLARTLSESRTVRLVVTGGARLTPVQMAAIRRTWPRARLVTSYGTAETSYLAMNGDPDPQDPSDMGDLFPGVSARSDGAAGFRVRTPYAALGRQQSGEGTLTLLTDEAGWIPIPDAAAVSGTGRLVLYGRSDDRLNLGGALVDPGPVERALETLAWVDEAVLLAVPDAERSDSAQAILIPAGALPGNAAAAVSARLRDLDSVPRPRAVHVLSGAPPRTPGGKLDRRALAQALAADTLPGWRLI